MDKSKYKVRLVQRNEVKDFVKNEHYSRSCPGGYLYLGLFYNSEFSSHWVLQGAAVFGQVAGQTTAQKWCPGVRGVIELRRLVCIDDTEQNIESFFLGKCLRYLKNYTNYKMVISLADPTYNHTGIIYKASNFKLVGRTQCRTDNCKLDGVVVHHRTLENKHNLSIKELKSLYGERLVMFKTEGKYVYLYDIRTKREKRDQNI